MRGEEKGRNDAILVLELNPVFLRAMETGIRVEADPMKGKGAAAPAFSNRTLCWRSIQWLKSVSEALCYQRS